MTLSDVRRPQADSIRPDAAELLGGAGAALLKENYPLRATIVRPGRAYEDAGAPVVEDYANVPAAIRAAQTQTVELKQTPMPVMREWYRVTCLRYMPEVRALDMVQVGGRSYTIQIPDAQQETMTTHLLVYLIP